jgi:hypothetical protein
MRAVMNRGIGIACIALSVVAAPVPALQGVESGDDFGEGGCGKPENSGCGSGYHRMPPTEWPEQFYENAHQGCMRCIDGSGWGCHPRCDVTFAANPARSSAYERLLRAAAKGDVDEVLKVAFEVPEFVVINRKRSAVQVLSCTRDRLVANLRLRGGARETRLAARLDANGLGSSQRLALATL